VEEEPVPIMKATLTNAPPPRVEGADSESFSARISEVEEVTESEALQGFTGQERWPRAEMIRHLESSTTPGKDIVFLMNRALDTAKNDVDRNKKDSQSVQNWWNNFIGLPKALALMENQEKAKDVVDALWPWAQQCMADKGLSVSQKHEIVSTVGHDISSLQEIPGELGRDAEENTVTQEEQDAQVAYKSKAVRLQARFLRSLPPDVYKMLCTLPEDIAPSAGLLSRYASEIGAQVITRRDALTAEEWPHLEQRYRTIRQYDVLESFLGERTKPPEGWYEKPTYAGVLPWVCTDSTDALSQEVGRRFADQYIAACMQDETGITTDENGQPDTLSFRGLRIRTFPDISKYPTIPTYSRLDVSGKRPWEFRKPLDITTLDFSDNRFTDATLPDFSTFDKLTTLDVSQNRLGTIPAWMHRLPKQCVVHVGGNELDEKAVQQANKQSKGTKETGPTFTLLSRDAYRMEQQRKEAGRFSWLTRG
jgi:hypothetical protein